MTETKNKLRMTAVTDPFKNSRQKYELPEGLTVDQMLTIAQPDRKKLAHAIVFVRGELIPREVWTRYKPKPNVLVEVRAFSIPRGGGGDGGKNPLRTILTIAVVAFAAWAGPALAGSLIGTQGVATLATSNLISITGGILTGAIGAAGLLAVNAIAPIRPPRLAELSGISGQNRDSPTLFIEGARNALRPFSPVPQVLGKYRHFPSLGAKSFTEVVGDKQFVRLLFVWGVGPLSIDTASLKIGETLLTEFEGVEIEHREGYSTDTPLTLFPAVVLQDDYSVLLDEPSSWITRTSDADADELSVDLTFPQGLVEFDDRGNRTNRQVTVEIEYMLTGTSPAVWTKIDTSEDKFKKTFDDSWMSLSTDDLDSVTFNHNRTSAVRHGIRWPVATGQYDIRVRRTTTDTSSTQIFDEVYLTAIRTIRNEDPVDSPVPVAKTAMVIQATDQLNNVVDEFNGLVTTVAKNYQPGSPSWVEEATQNPASLFRHVLQGGANASPVPDSRIDLTNLIDWFNFCETKGFKFNMIRDFKTSIWETLADVAAAGRAAPTQIDGKWGVVYEQVQALPTSHVTPRNSFDFRAEKFFVDLPHAWRIPFANEDESYRVDERIVYRDGYTSVNATDFEQLELPGITDKEQIFKMGRFRIAQTILQPERWSFKQDMEYLTFQRGDKILITHDVLLVGLYYGRIKSVTLTGSPAVDVSEVELDEEVTMESGKSYGISIRTINGQYTQEVNTVVGTTKTLTLTTPISGVGSPAAAAVSAGNIFGFGILGAETDEASIISIIPDSNMRAKITAVPYREAIFDSDSEAIPAFVTNLTPLPSITAPEVNQVVSDESAMSISPGDSLKVRIGVDFKPLDTDLFDGVAPELRVQVRPSNTMEPWTNAEIDSQETNHVFIAGVRTGETWDIRLRFVIPGRLPGPWASISNHTVIGKSTPPAPLTGLTLNAIGNYAFLRWDAPQELDVIFGGEVVFRHTQELSNPDLAESVTIGQAARAKTLFAALPLKAGTYMARVFDQDGNASETVATVSTKQASIHGFTSASTIDEATAFAGTKTDVVVSAGDLTIDDAVSPDVLTGMYEFANAIDLSTVTRVRLTTRIAVTIFNQTTNIDDRLDNMDSWDDFDQSLEDGADCIVEVRHTDDDPTGSPVSWSTWERLESAEFEARAFEFRATLTRDSVDINILLDELGVDAETVT